MRRRILKTVARILIDFIVAGLCFPTAVLLQSDGRLPQLPLSHFASVVFAVALLKIVVYTSLGGPNRMWRYTSLREGVVLWVVAVVSAVILAALRFAGVFPFSLSVVAIDGTLFLLGVAGVRALRLLQIVQQHRRGHGESVRTLIVGAGDTANSLVDDLESLQGGSWNIVGLLDDNRSKWGQTLRGYPILGPTTDLEAVIRRETVRFVVIAMPSAQKVVVRQLIDRAQHAGASVKVVPALEDLLKGDGTGRRTTPVTLRDLVDSAEVKRTLIDRVRRVRSAPLVLVTGGAGYIGGHVVRKLLDRGCTVRVLDNFLYGSQALAGLQGHERLDVVDGDISSVRDVVSAVKSADAVIALAAIVGDPACGINAEETLNLNYEATKILVETANFYGVRRLVFASSCSVYGAADNELLSEQSPLNPVSLYARTRIMSEDVIFSRCGDVEPVVLRLATVFGLSPRMRFDLVVNTLTVRAVVTGRIQIFGGDQWRPFVHCQDAAEAFCLAATLPADKVRGQVFNVGSSEMNYTIAQVGELVAEEVVGVKLNFVEATDDLRNYRVSFEKIRKALGFVPVHDLRAGVREMIAEIREDARLRAFDNPSFSNHKALQDRFESAGSAEPNGRLLLVD